MTTPSTARRAGPFTGNGSQNSWAFTFKVFDTSDVKVTVADAAGAETVLVLGTDYSVTLNPNQDTSPGGSVTYLLANGGKLTVTGDLDYDQPLDIPGGGNFNPVAFENQLDRMVMQTQQLAEEMGRAVKVPVTEEASGQLSTDLANGILALSPIVADIETVAANVVAVDNVSDNMTTVSAVGGNITNVNTVAGISSNVTSVAGNATNINAVAAKTTQITQVAAIDDEVAAVAGNATNVNTVAGISANVTTVAGIAANVTTVAGISANVTSVAGNATNINAVAAAASDVALVADNLADVSNFADVYQGAKASAPTLRNDGSALQLGDLYFATNTATMRAYGAGGWSDAASATPVTITAQSFNGNGSTTAFTLSAAPAFEAACDVYVSGVHQVVDVDYNIAGTTLTFTTAPPSGTGNIAVKILSPYAAGVLEFGSVNTASLADGAVTRAKIAAGAAGMTFTEIASGSFPAAASVTFSGLSTDYDGFKLIYSGVNTSWSSGTQITWSVDGGAYITTTPSAAYATNKSAPYAGQIVFYNRKANTPLATPAVFMSNFSQVGSAIGLPASLSGYSDRNFFRAAVDSGADVSEITALSVSAIGGNFTAGTYQLIGFKYGG